MTESGSRKRILIFADWFEPAYKAGGPIRSCVNFVQNLESDYDIFVFTGSRDLNENHTLHGIDTDTWLNYGRNSKVYYASGSQLGLKNIAAVIDTLKPDFIYLNSVFSKHFTIYPLLIKRFRRPPSIVVLAPRGMLKPSALQFKAGKKKLFLQLFKLLGLQHFVRFHATDNNEVRDIQQCFKTAGPFLAPNFPGSVPSMPARLKKQPGELSIIFIGRIHPIKNLDYLLDAIKTVRGSLHLTIVGVMEQPEYWSRCEQIIKQFPSSIQVSMLGEIPHHRLPAEIAKHHIFALPTQGENFGHAIFDALKEGKPVIISDQTPWKNLQANKAGWDVNLNQPQMFTNALQQAVDWNQNTYDQWSLNAQQLARNFVNTDHLKEKYKQIFS